MTYTIFSPESHTVFPFLHVGIPEAGWLRLSFNYPNETLEFVTSCTPEDSLVTLVVWLEMLLLGELPALWYVNSEEIGMYINARPLTEEIVQLIIYHPIRCTDPFESVAEDPDFVWWRGSVSIQPFVSAWSTSLYQALATNFSDRAEWPLAVHRLDFSRLNALLDGAAADLNWLSAYRPPEKRVRQLSQAL